MWPPDVGARHGPVRGLALTRHAVALASKAARAGATAGAASRAACMGICEVGLAAVGFRRSRRLSPRPRRVQAARALALLRWTSSINHQVERLRGIFRYSPSVTRFFFSFALVVQSSFFCFGLVAPWILMISMVKTSTPATRPLSPYARLDGMYISHLSPATTAPSQ